VGGADIAAICSEERLPSRDGVADDDKTSCAARYLKTAGDKGSFGGGVGGIGELNLKVGGPHFSSLSGMTRVGREFRLATEAPETRFEAVDLRLLVVRVNPTLEDVFRYFSSSEETS